MPEAPQDLTLALVLTAAGATLSSALITGVVEIIKRLIPSISTLQTRWAAFILSALLVAVAYFATVSQQNAVTAFAAFVAWYGIARLSLANHDDATAQVNSLRGPTA